MRCSNRKLLIVFEGSAQRERTIVRVCYCKETLSFQLTTCQSMHIILCSQLLWLVTSSQPLLPSLMQSSS